ncbi:UDP-N-acetylglucosamine 2-epimerase [Nodularia spumigena]|uniref:UDP-N-acetylglucosamine 2-epimerase n=1 Tax=Nodularia spumigena TaxID=70799 RepID=UPI000D30F050|nr:UDP-N-acetylglucosamine 2-epimerase [Nodularia spumigena]
MNQRRKICIVTGTRAEYGLLYWLIKEIADDPDLQLQIIATGMHLSPEFGLTYQQIESDGFTIDAKVEMLLSSDTPVGIAKSIGLGVIGFADALERLKPDILVVLGDRFEVLAAAQAAMVSRIPIAHIHGGEATEGLIDEAIRHSVTKMAHIHFTAAESYRMRVVQLGENPERVFNVGALGLDNFTRLDLLDRASLERSLNCHFTTDTIILCTYHPVTLTDSSVIQAVDQIFQAFDQFPKAQIVFTKSNADAGGRIINKMIDTYVDKNKTRATAFTSLGQVRYLSLLIQSSVVVGNSSSGILEAPTALTPTVNIGDRQCGRLKAPSIIDCDDSAESIVKAITKALSPEFQQIVTKGESFYGKGYAAKSIKQIIKGTSLEKILFKQFYNLNHVL